MNTINTLVIVESPAKCKKIESYLGPGYKVIASFGHLRHISDLKSIDTENGYKIAFSIIDEPLKKKQIEKIRTEIKKADDIILATDSDREGEAISWHICDLFELDVSRVKRIVFNEITETAIQNAIRTPTKINMNLVNAQKTRQIIDILVGFNISPFLWKQISINKSSNLSAGRCQTPALRLIYDNYREIQERPGKLVYNTTGCFTNLNLNFDLNVLFTETEQVKQFLNWCNNKCKFLCNISEPKKSIKKQPEPLTTSSLQQLASNELHLSPKDTMKYAQQLYEAGYITYMRTDCKKYSKAFVDQVKEYIEKIHDKTYISQNIDLLIMEPEQKQDKIEEQTDKKSKRVKKVKEEKSDNLAQEAHEAIRPVSINVLIPELGELQAKALKLYSLIWKRSLESCMPSAQYNAITAKIQLEPEYIDPVTNKKCEFSYKAEQISFPGFQVVERSYELVTKDYQYFTNIKQNTYLVPKRIDSKSVLHELVSHYTEAHLVKLLEEKGIGRPSTFASLIDKIQEREYVTKQDVKGQKRECIDFSLFNSEIRETKQEKEFGNEKSKLVIQPIGIVVIEMLIKHFNDFFNYEYTKTMENDLDLIATNKKEWLSVCDDCNSQLQNISTTLKGEPKFSIYIDDSHEIIIGKFGPIIKKTSNNTTSNGQHSITFIPLKKDIDINQLKYIPEIKLEDIADFSGLVDDNNVLLGKYKGEDLYLKKGKYGLYVKWGAETKNLKELGNRPIENVKYLEVLHILERDNVLDLDKPIGVVRELSSTISIRTGKYGDYIFYKKPRAKNAQFFKLKGFNEDYKKCNKDLILCWIKDTYNVE